MPWSALPGPSDSSFAAKKPFERFPHKLHQSPPSCPRLSRASRLGEHSASLSEMAGTSPAMMRLSCQARQIAVQVFVERTTMPSARKKPASPKREYKSQRLELRVAPSAKKVIQQAMAVSGLAAGDLAYEA